ncbi:polysaccharide deacetylase family protein [Saccharopolyspora griseoalba]|uniref:Polysaccharide deacetylase family protein n=1 Tax=Saccharopolyspora griseoalba TaxID=1431848 RepID=A0ABW2LEV0_9PSEU
MTSSRSTRTLLPLLLVAALGGTAFTTPEATPEIIDSTGVPGRTVALTFDDGPDATDTPALLRVLGEHDVRAVFCLWGDHVRQNPDLVRRIVAEGHVLCNHTTHHDDLAAWTPEAVRADLVETNDLVRAAAPHAEVAYFRAPYGSWGESPEVAADLGMQPLGWRFDVEDWNPPGTEVLVQRFADRVSPQAVALLHDGGGDRSQTAAAVDEIIPRLRAEGWRFVLPAGPRG